MKQARKIAALTPLGIFVWILSVMPGFSFLPTVDAFVPSVSYQHSLRSHKVKTPLKVSSQDVEQARAFLENLMEQQQELDDKQMLAEHEALLTTTGRHRRLLEIELMKSLLKSEDAVNELMHLWMYENDASMAQELEEMQDECSAGMVYEETRLREMIQQFPTWAEPRARLALLLFFQGRTADSYNMALDTLILKPWHFEIYPLLVLLSLRQGEFGQALSWARRSLPPYRENGKNKRRNEWIRIAVELAEDQLYQAEQRTRSDDRVCLSKPPASVPRQDLGNFQEEGAWQ
mmetsp:Transcript_14499/g.27583  ORF Transcript_14499/g.27583 Transcript_14499/m.27583 type:complete len:290 (-) Transcript_14499:139-1008(-)|eukprot:scaffold1803_cov92-Amphora_coffeaeformis.AAC.77